jgi:chaperonin GroEL (HSP60 family)
MNMVYKNNSGGNYLNYNDLFQEGSRRTSGTDARRYNLLAAKLIANLAKDMLGPKGLQKMFIDILDETTVTKDGATFLRKIDVEHPAAKVLIEASNAVDNEVGDGTTSVVVLAGALIEKAEDLLAMNIAPATICEGYEEGMKIALRVLQAISKTRPNFDIETMQAITRTCLTSKAISYSSLSEDSVAKLVVNATLQVADFTKNKLDIDNIKIEEKPGDPSHTQLIDGIILDKTIDSSSMPKSIENARILLIDDDLEAQYTKTQAEINVSSPEQYKLFVDVQSVDIMQKVQKVIDCGANVVICRNGISLLARTHFANAGIISVRRVKENDMLWLEKATGATIIRDLSSNLSESIFGYAGQVCERFVGDDKMVFIENCRNPKAVTLLLRASSKKMLDEYHRSMLDALNVLRDYIDLPSIVAGGGSTEIIIAREVRKKSVLSHGRKQIVLQKFADALEDIPLTIAKNAGMNILDTLAQLRAKNVPPDLIHYSSIYDADNRIQYRKINASNVDKERLPSENIPIVNGKWFGVNAMHRCVEEMFALGVIEPSVVKEQIIKTAVEVTDMLLRVDDVLITKPTMDTHAHGHSHTHTDGTSHSHEGGDKVHDHYFDMLGKHQRPMHHYY